MRGIVKVFVIGTLGLAVLIGSPVSSFAKPKKPLNLCVCKCLKDTGDTKVYGYGSVLTAGACSKSFEKEKACVDKAGNKFTGDLWGCQQKGTVAAGLTPGTGGVLQPPANAPAGAVKPPVTPGQKQR